jgi:hypothetical protein
VDRLLGGAVKNDPKSHEWDTKQELKDANEK